MADAKMLVKELESAIILLKSDAKAAKGAPLTDNFAVVQHFCAALERVLRCNIKVAAQGQTQLDYFHFLADGLRNEGGDMAAVNHARQQADLRTNTGIGRALIRYMLNHHTLAESVQLACTDKLPKERYNAGSVFLNSALWGRVQDMLYDLNDIKFDLRQTGVALDKGWPQPNKPAGSTEATPSAPIKQPSQSSLAPPERPLSAAAVTPSVNEDVVVDVNGDVLLGALPSPLSPAGPNVASGVDDGSKQRIDELLAEVASLRHQLTENSALKDDGRAAWQSTVANLQAETLSLRKISEDKQAELVKAREQIEQLTEDIQDEKDGHVQDVEILRKQLAEVSTASELKGTQALQLEAEYKGVVASLEATTTELSALKATQSTLVLQNQTASAEHQRQLTALQQQLTDLQAANLRLEGLCATLTSRSEQLDSKVASLEQTVAEKDRRLAEAAETEASLREELTQAESTFTHRLEMERARAVADRSELERKVSNLTKEVERKGDDISQQLNVEASKANQRVEEAVAEAARHAEARLQAEQEVHRKALEAVNEELARATELSKETTSQHTAALTGLHNDLEVARSNFATAQASVVELTASTTRLEAEVQALHQSLDAQKEELRIAQLAQSDQVSQSRKRLQELEVELTQVRAAADAAAEAARFEIADVKLISEAAQEARRAALDARDAIQLQIDGFKQAAVDAQHAARDAAAKEAGARAALAQSEIQRAEVESRLANAQSEKQRQSSTVDVRVKEVEKENLKLKAKLEKVISDFKVADNERETLRRQLDRIKEQSEKESQDLRQEVIQKTLDKQELWQKAASLEDQLHRDVTESWRNSDTVLNCERCNAQFSLFLRKHHCRKCGGVFCFACSDHWAMLSFSESPVRVCVTCNNFITSLKTKGGDDSTTAGALEDTLKALPSGRDNTTIKSSDTHSIKTNGTASGIAPSALMKSASAPIETSALASVEESSAGAFISKLVGSIFSTTPPANPTPATRLIGEPVRISEHEDVASSPSKVKPRRNSLEQDAKASLTMEDDRRFMTAPVQGAGDSEEEDAAQAPAKTVSATMAHVDESTFEEVIVKAGKTFEYPIMIESSHVLIKWHFRTAPKDIAFGVSYKESHSDDADVSYFVKSLERYPSHQELVSGSILAEKAGIYTLYFDNTYSRLMNKKLNYQVKTSVTNV